MTGLGNNSYPIHFPSFSISLSRLTFLSWTRSIKSAQDLKFAPAWQLRSALSLGIFLSKYMWLLCSFLCYQSKMLPFYSQAFDSLEWHFQMHKKGDDPTKGQKLESLLQSSLFEHNHLRHSHSRMNWVCDPHQDKCSVSEASEDNGFQGQQEPKVSPRVLS